MSSDMKTTFNNKNAQCSTQGSASFSFFSFFSTQAFLYQITLVLLPILGLSILVR